ncbi:P-loop containing nucleoside triphosphate hydrolase protein [Podospora appendiculata]|uniref:P-loop containing nucleoside triphosphate hydrolase protein n=1 Tax=Podospora appendiculata TaxID=314037 RepID=A0AAE0XBV1_9PEZI|nr:P-loop containing nucleoside triphosphate hydrolase protein [Podospora appendiculata]
MHPKLQLVFFYSPSFISRPLFSTVINIDYSSPDKINMAVAEDTVINSEEAAAGKPAVPVTQKSTFQRSSSKHLFVFTRPGHVWMIASAIFTAALAAAGRAAYTIVFGRIFDLSSQWGASAIAGHRFLSETSQWCIYMCLIGLGMWLVSSIELALWVISGELRARTARDTLFGSLLKKTAEWYDMRENGMSSLMVAVQTQTRELQIATSQVLGFLAVDIFVFLACIIPALVYSYQLTLVMLATDVPSALILWTISRFLDPAIEAQRRELAQASQNATAAATAIELVKVYNGADHEAFRFISAIRQSAKYYSRQALCNCGQLSYTRLWMLMLFVVGFFFAVNLVGKGQLTPGNALTTFYAALIAFQSIQILGPQWLMVAKGMAAGQSLQALVSELQDGQQVDKVSGCYQPSSCFGNIHMHNVSFAYPSNPANLVLSPSNFHFPAGEITFVVGRSGSGKSTLGNLLLRFYEPLTGDITVDGNTITRLDLEWVRRNITLVQQSSILFRDTFFQNVAFGAPDHVSADEVQEACSMALLQSTITGMPHGMDTLIGPGASSLRGGQRQRLALARAKLRDPPVLILDEITSGLDPVSRSLIMEAIRIWRKGKTTIIITHEVGYIADDEYVYVLEGGRIVQERVRKGLAEVQSGLFASLLASADDENQSRDSDSEF